LLDNRRADAAVPRQTWASAGHRQPEYDAWWKSMILQATLWVQPYVREGDF
jgi:hypothetical protein